jgi:hypothetical protein
VYGRWLRDLKSALTEQTRASLEAIKSIGRNTKRRIAKVFKAAMFAAMLTLTGHTAVSQGADLAATWPNKPVRLIVNFGLGGSADNSARPYAERLSRALGQQFVIENKGVRQAPSAWKPR